MRRGVWLALLLGACGSEIDPYCSAYDDPTGRGVALCRSVVEQPVCDDEGDEARFERVGGVIRLVGGTPALCDEMREVVCADRMGVPRCLRELDE